MILIPFILIAIAYIVIYEYPEFKYDYARKKFLRESKPGDLWKHNIFEYTIQITSISDYYVTYQLTNVKAYHINTLSIKYIINNYTKVNE